jgi:hypothetical protein
MYFISANNSANIPTPPPTTSPAEVQSVWLSPVCQGGIHISKESSLFSSSDIKQSLATSINKGRNFNLPDFIDIVLKAVEANKHLLLLWIKTL